MASRPAPSLITDSGIKVLLLTAGAYEAAYLYEFFYLAHFGVPVFFVDVSLHELLLCGIPCVVASFVIIWVDIVWGAIPTKAPPLLRKALMTLFILIIGTLVLCTLLDAFLLGASLIGLDLLAAAVLLLLPLMFHRHLPKIASRYWAAFGGDRSDEVKGPSLLWYSVSRGIVMAIGFVVIVGVFSSAFGTWRARVQRDFAIANLTDNCAVLRLSSDGYLCVGIDFHKHVPLQTFRLLDPKGLELHLLRVGPIAAAPFGAPPPVLASAH